MKKVAMFIFLLGMTSVIPNFLFAQRIVWEKHFSLSIRDDVKSVFRLSDSTYFVFGNTLLDNYIFQANIPRIVSFNIGSNGDTSNLKMYIDSINFPVFCQGIKRNNFWFVGNSSGRKEGLYLNKISTNGNILFHRFFAADSSQPGYNNSVNQIFPTNDDGILLIGNKSLMLNGRNATLEYVSRYDSLGNQLWFRTFLFINGACSPNRIEPTNRGTFLISGSDGPDIYIHEIDSTGYPIRRRVLYTHPQRYGWWDAKVWQHPEGYVVIGSDASYNTSNTFFAGFYEKKN